MRLCCTSLHPFSDTYASIYCRTYHVGGTNLRVCLVTVQGDGKFEITQSKYRLTEEQKQDEGQKLFDFCAECLKTFVDSNLADELKPGHVLPLGFTVRTALVSDSRLWSFIISSNTVLVPLFVSIHGMTRQVHDQTYIVSGRIRSTTASLSDGPKVSVQRIQKAET